MFPTILIDSGSGKTNVLHKLMKHQRPNIDKIHWYVKDPFEPKYQLLINGREKVGIKKLKNPKALIDYSQAIDNVYENLEDHNPIKKRKVLIMFHDMIADMKANKKVLCPLNCFNISLVFISRSYFKVPKTKCNTVLMHC